MCTQSSWLWRTKWFFESFHNVLRWSPQRCVQQSAPLPLLDRCSFPGIMDKDSPKNPLFIAAKKFYINFIQRQNCMHQAWHWILWWGCRKGFLLMTVSWKERRGTPVTWLALTCKFEDLILAWITLIQDSTWLWLSIHDLTSLRLETYDSKGLDLFNIYLYFSRYWEVTFRFLKHDWLISSAIRANVATY